MRTFPLTLGLLLALTAAVAAQEQTSQTETQQGDTAPAAQPQAQQSADPEAQSLRQPQASLDDLRAALAQTLRAMDVPDQDQLDRISQRLDALAVRSADLAANTDQPGEQLEYRNLEMQAYNGLALNAQRKADADDNSRRLTQLRSTAWSTKNIAAPGASLVGEFWLLQADLYDINRSVPDPDDRQLQAIRRLERFVQMAPPPEVSPEGSTDATAALPGAGSADELSGNLVQEVKLSLLRLYDQQGRSDAAAALVADLRSDRDTAAELHAQLDRHYGYVALLRQPFEAKLRIDAQRTWSSAEQAGKVVLIYFGADWFEPSLAARRAVRNAHDRYHDRGLSVLGVEVAPETPMPDEVADSAEASATLSVSSAPGAPTAQLPWPVYRQGPGQVSLTEMFEVRSLPRFVLIDRAGRIAAIAGGVGVLNRIEGLLAAPAPADNSPMQTELRE